MFHANLIPLLVHNSPTASGIILVTALSRRRCNPSVEDSNIALSVGQLYLCVCSGSQEMPLLINNGNRSQKSSCLHLNSPKPPKWSGALKRLHAPIKSIYVSWHWIPLSPCCSSSHEPCLCHLLAFGLLPDARFSFVHSCTFVLQWKQGPGGGVHLISDDISSFQVHIRGTVLHSDSARKIPTAVRAGFFTGTGLGWMFMSHISLCSLIALPCACSFSVPISNWQFTCGSTMRF